MYYPSSDGFIYPIQPVLPEKKSYSSIKASISRENKLEAIRRFVPFASTDESLTIDLLVYMEKRIKEIHCVVLSSRLPAVNAILASHGITLNAKKTITINEFGSVCEL